MSKMADFAENFKIMSYEWHFPCSHISDDGLLNQLVLIYRCPYRVERPLKPHTSYIYRENGC